MPKENPVRSWILLVYNVPRQPSASRVYVWRKLKRLGAVLLQDAVWVLPDTPQTKEHFQWLATEIKELQGEATLWLGTLLADEQEAGLIRQFGDTVEAGYREILDELKTKGPDLPGLSRRYQQLATQDYFYTKLGERVRAELMKSRGKGSSKS
jgi:hypothetical protein